MAVHPLKADQNRNMKHALPALASSGKACQKSLSAYVCVIGYVLGLPSIGLCHLDHHPHVFKLGIYRTLATRSQKESSFLSHLVNEPLTVVTDFLRGS